MSIKNSSKQATKKAPTPPPSGPAPQPSPPPPAAASCYLPFIPRRPMGESEEIKPPNRRPYRHLELCKHLNIQENLLKRLLDFIAGRLPDYSRRTLHKEGICEILRKIEFPPDFCVIVDNAKYNEEHVGFLLWKAYLVAEARHITNNRRKAQYAREKRKKNGAVILLENMACHKESIDLFRKEVLETQERRELFGKKLEMILEALANFKNDFDTTATLRAQGGEKANEMTDPLLQDQEEHSEMIARLKNDLEMLGGLGNDIAVFEGNMKKLVQEHILRESTA